MQTLQLDDLLRKVDYLGERDLALLTKAYDTAAKAHLDQNRMSGEKYIQHPLAVADILADLRLDAETLATAILHDVVEDTYVTVVDLRRDFGPDIARLVEGVTKLEKISVYSAEQAQAENLRKMLVAMAEDIRVVLIKLADRLHNMRTVAPLPPNRRTRMARETLDIYAPLAHRLGIGQVKWELEDLAFAELNPEAYAEVVQLIKRKRKERESFVGEVREILARELEGVGITAEITGRPKHIYSVWQKMEGGAKTFDEIYDLIAVRVAVDTIKDCYGVLGVVHSLWKPVPGRFKDYVAMPKSNGYQSLHTTVITHTGEPIEIQIRTHEMHRIAEFGVAAHWAYKEGGRGQDRPDERLSWMRLLMEWQKDVVDAENFVDHVKGDIFQDETFVFTPKGDVRSLPSRSTPIDFAYRIHTEVGHHCIGAKVNGRMVPLDYELQNGEIVEILTSKGPHGPSRDWLNFVKTSSAREKIRQWFKRERRDENITRGKDLLDRELKRISHQSLAAVSDEVLLEVAREFHYQELNDFFAAVGYGDISPRPRSSRSPRPSPSPTPPSRRCHPRRARRPRAVCACMARATCSRPWRSAASRSRATRSPATSHAARGSLCTAWTASTSATPRARSGWWRWSGTAPRASCSRCS